MAGHTTGERPIRMAVDCGWPMVACAQSGGSARGCQEFFAPSAASAFPAATRRTPAQAACLCIPPLINMHCAVAQAADLPVIDVSRLRGGRVHPRQPDLVRPDRPGQHRPAAGALRTRAAFEAAARAIPALAAWIHPEQARPITPVLPGGRLYNSYRGQLNDAGHVALDGLAVGPYQAMLAPPSSLNAVQAGARDTYATGWRPPKPPGPTRDQLVSLVTASASSPGAIRPTTRPYPRRPRPGHARATGGTERGRGPFPAVRRETAR